MALDFNFKYYNEKKLISLIIILYLFIELIIKLLINLLESNDLAYYRFYPSAILMAIVFSYINKNLHDYPKIWKLLIKVPLIRGTYLGKVEYHYNGEDSYKNCKLIIKQTTSDICVDCYFWEKDKTGEKILRSQTQSESIVEDLVLEKNGLYNLLFYYRQKGTADSSIPIREGFNILKVKKDGKITRLDGNYFVKDGRSKGNGGSMTVNLSSKQLNH